MIDTVRGRHSSAQRAPLSITPLDIAAALIGLIPLVVHSVTVWRGYFWQDDFLLLRTAAKASAFDPAYLLQDYDGHLIPGVLFLASAVTDVDPLGYRVAVLPLLAMQALLSVQCWRLLLGCFGRRRATLVPFTLFAFSPLVLVPTLWWSAAAQLVPLLLAMVSALGAHGRYLDTGLRRHAVYAALWTGFGLAFSERAVLIPALLFGLSVLHGGVTPLRRVLTERWHLWSGHAAVLVGYLVLRTVLIGGHHEVDRPVDLAQHVGRTLVDTLARGLFGGPWGGHAVGTLWPAPGFEARVAAVVLTIAVVVAGFVVSGRSALRAWLLVAGYVAADIALVAFTGFGAFGTVLPDDPRFVADAAAVAIVFGAFAFRDGTAGRAIKLGVTGLTVVYAITATVTTARTGSALRFTDVLEYVAAVRESLAADPDVVLFDAPVPDAVMKRARFGDETDVSKLTELLPRRTRFDAPTEEMSLIDGHGVARRITKVDDARTGQKGPVPDCGWAVDRRTTMVQFPEQVTGRHVLLIDYYTADSGEGTVTVAGREQIIEFQTGVHQLALVVDGSFARVDLRRDTSVAPVCVAVVRVGDPTVEP
ncbi:MAG TPA: hypothetical protein VM677_14305 [Actinokineospora sp.]|nr:hypothetical protein [Actinokineospora sp.]